MWEVKACYNYGYMGFVRVRNGLKMMMGAKTCQNGAVPNGAESGRADDEPGRMTNLCRQ